MSDRRDSLAPAPFRILRLDGGGTFALIQALALDALDPGQSGHEVLSPFDLGSPRAVPARRRAVEAPLETSPLKIVASVG
jgi:hypothetical protein